MIYKKEFKEWFEDNFKNEYKYEGNVETQNSIITVTHLKCKHTYELKAGTFYSGRRCSKCAGNLKWNTEKLDNFIREITENEYYVIGDYVNNNTPIDIFHEKCKKSFKMRPANFKFGNRCPYCKNRKKKNIDEIKKRVFQLVGNEYTIKSTKYINNKTPLEFHHNKCNNDFLMTSKDFLKNNGNRCPKCKRSKGELEIEKILNKYNIKFISDVRDSGCKNIKNLQFDFKVYLNKEEFCYIEFDGKFHYEPFKNNKKEKEHLKRQIQNDKIKNDFCIENNIKLIRIDYRDFNNIENILIENLNL